MENNFARNLKRIREERKLSQNKLGNLTGFNQTTIARWEAGEVVPTIDNVFRLANFLEISLPEILGSSISYNDIEYINIEDIDTVKIPVYGSIQAGKPMNTQDDISRYIDIPKDWIKNRKLYFALDIKGNSMYPKYCENDIVIFEQVEYCDEANNKDCAIMVNSTEFTFKKVYIDDTGITLVPYNTSDFSPVFFTREQAEDLPITIVGIAIKRISNI